MKLVGRNGCFSHQILFQSPLSRPKHDLPVIKKKNAWQSIWILMHEILQRQSERMNSSYDSPRRQTADEWRVL